MSRRTGIIHINREGGGTRPFIERIGHDKVVFGAISQTWPRCKNGILNALIGDHRLNFPPLLVYLPLPLAMETDVAASAPVRR